VLLVEDEAPDRFKLTRLALERRRRSSWRRPWATHPVRFEA
jgi:hypothetical protein